MHVRGILTGFYVFFFLFRLRYRLNNDTLKFYGYTCLTKNVQSSAVFASMTKKYGNDRENIVICLVYICIVECILYINIFITYVYVLSFARIGRFHYNMYIYVSLLFILDV